MDASEIASNIEMRTPLLHALHWIVTAIETVGVATIVAGAFVSTALFLQQGRGRKWDEAFRHYKANLGRGILLGLEFLIAADIIGTVAVTPTFQSLGVLALIIAIRTFLSFSLDVEIEGQWPWRRRESERRPHQRPSGLTSKRCKAELRYPRTGGSVLASPCNAADRHFAG